MAATDVIDLANVKNEPLETRKQCSKKFIEIVRKIYVSINLDIHPTTFKCRSHLVMKWGCLVCDLANIHDLEKKHHPSARMH